jgi:hypothetical protein
MKPDELASELEQAACELGRAEQHERAAKTLRVRAIKRTSAVHLIFCEALKEARMKTSKPTKRTKRTK